MPKVTVNLSNRPEGSAVNIPHLGKFENGTTVEVDQRRWNRYVKNQPGAQDLADEVEVVITKQGMARPEKGNKQPVPIQPTPDVPPPTNDNDEVEEV